MSQLSVEHMYRGRVVYVHMCMGHTIPILVWYSSTYHFTTHSHSVCATYTCTYVRTTYVRTCVLYGTPCVLRFAASAVFASSTATLGGVRQSVLASPTLPTAALVPGDSSDEDAHFLHTQRRARMRFPAGPTPSRSVRVSIFMDAGLRAQRHAA